MEKKIENRIEYLDLLRIIAIFGVVVLHVAAQNWVKEFTNVFNWNVYNVYDSLVRWTVPVFVMISGTLFLSKEYSIKKIHSKKIFRIITALGFWSVVYILLYRRSNSITDIIYNLLIGNYHMWFMFMIIGLYIITPFLKKIVESEELMKYFIIVSFIFSCFIPQLINILSEFSSNMYIQTIINAINYWIEKIGFGFGYAMYYVIGYYISKKDFSKNNRIIIYVLGLFGVLITIFGTMWCSRISNTPRVIFYDNFSIGVFLESISVYVFAKYNFKSNNIINYMSKISFGIYLIHIIPLWELEQKMGITSSFINPIISVPLLSIGIFIVSAIISTIINKIPIIKKYIV